MTCVSLFVGTWRSHRLVFPASSSSLRMYFPSGEIAASADLPLLVICEIAKFWNGGDVLAGEQRVDAIARCGQHDERDHKPGRRDPSLCCFADFDDRTAGGMRRSAVRASRRRRGRRSRSGAERTILPVRRPRSPFARADCRRNRSLLSN